MKTRKSTNIVSKRLERSYVSKLGYYGLIAMSALLPERLSAEVAAANNIIGLDEVIVTARKKAEVLQTTPVAVTAFSGAMLESLSASQLSSIGEFTPNMEFNVGEGGSASQANIYIRGIGQSDFLISSDPGVGIYVDGIYYARTLGGVLDLLDVERIEVLRGPQGTLFGRNTIGGAINIVTQRPGPETEGLVDITVGQFNRLDVAASAQSTVIEDKLFFRVSGTSNNRDGYGERLTDGVKTGDIDSSSGKLSLLWQASDAVEVLATVDGTRKREEALPTSLVRVEPGVSILALYNTLIAGPSGLPIDENIILDNPFESYASAQSVNDLDVWGAGITIDWKINDILSAKSITGYRELDVAFSFDMDSSPYPYADSYRVSSQKQFSQEFQLAGEHDRLSWVGGLYYFYEKGQENISQDVFGGLYDLIGLDNSIRSQTDIQARSYAIFGQAVYSLTNSVRFTIGGRYNYDKKNTTLFGQRPYSGVITLDNVTREDSWGAFSPKVGLDYQVNDDIMIYANVARGFKSGGFNGRAGDGAALQAYGPEYVWSYETGVKSRWLDDRLEINITGFYNDYKDIQLLSAMPDPSNPDGADLIIAVDNAGEATTQGFEVEVQARPVSALNIFGGLGYTKAKFEKINPGVTAVNLNSKFVDTPEWNIFGGLQYELVFGNAGSLVLNADASYKSGLYRDVSNSPELYQNGYALVNARMTYIAPSANWEIAIFGTNLTDKRYIHKGVGLANSIGFTTANFGRPREWGAKVRYHF